MRPSVQTLFSLFLFTLASFAFAAEAPKQTEEEKKIYRSFTADGVVEFTDNPKKGGAEIQLETLPTYKQAPVPAIQFTPRKKKIKILSVKVYQAMSIVSPANNSTLRDNAGNVVVETRLQPKLKKGLNHKVQYFLDGKLAKTGGLKETLSNVDRGRHKLQAKAVDAKGKVLQESNTVLFHLKRYFKPKAKVEPQPAPVPDPFGSDDDV